jgi:hypothetical protein
MQSEMRNPDLAIRVGAGRWGKGRIIENQQMRIARAQSGITLDSEGAEPAADFTELGEAKAGVNPFCRVVYSTLPARWTDPRVNNRYQTLCCHRDSVRHSG